jgi:hypothetical protein
MRMLGWTFGNPRNAGFGAEAQEFASGGLFLGPLCCAQLFVSLNMLGFVNALSH